AALAYDRSYPGISARGVQHQCGSESGDLPVGSLSAANQYRVVPPESAFSWCGSGQYSRSTGDCGRSGHALENDIAAPTTSAYRFAGISAYLVGRIWGRLSERIEEFDQRTAANPIFPAGILCTTSHD